MSHQSPVADVLEVVMSTSVARVKVVPGDRIVVSASVAAAMCFGDNETTPSLTPQVMATATLTSDDVFLDTETVTIGGKVYTFKTTLVAGVANQVLIGVNQTASHLNLKSAVNGLKSARGTTYTAATTENDQVWASSANGTTTVFLAKRSGTIGNTIATTETCGHAAFGGAVMASGAGEYGQIYLGTAAVAREFIVPSRVVVPGPVGSQSRAVTSISVIAGGAGTFTVVVLG